MIPEARHYRLVSALFLRLLALIYLVAFLSLWPQIAGLAGSQGILPLGEALAALRVELGWEAYLQLPTLFWLGAGEGALRAAVAAGAGFALLLLLGPSGGRLERVGLVALFVLYLSLAHAGQLFLNFQWDYLLLEAGFLAIFLRGGGAPVILLLRFLEGFLENRSVVTGLLAHNPFAEGPGPAFVRGGRIASRTGRPGAPPGAGGSPVSWIPSRPCRGCLIRPC